jgi:hypothetical protein
MYCPACFNNSLFVQSKGTINIVINGMQRDSGKILFNLEDTYSNQLMKDLEAKCGEFFQWYSNFNNPEPINYVELLTPNMKCENGCNFPPNQKFTAIDYVVSAKTLKELIKKLGEKYNMEVELKI